jgi:hypothetical protein
MEKPDIPMPLGEGLNVYQIAGAVRCLYCGDPTPLQVRSDFALWHPKLGIFISKLDTTAILEGSNVQGLP